MKMGNNNNLNGISKFEKYNTGPEIITSHGLREIG